MINGYVFIFSFLSHLTSSSPHHHIAYTTPSSFSSSTYDCQRHSIDPTALIIDPSYLLSGLLEYCFSLSHWSPCCPSNISLCLDFALFSGFVLVTSWLHSSFIFHIHTLLCGRMSNIIMQHTRDAVNLYSELLSRESTELSPDV